MGIAFTVVCLSFLDPILRFFGASDATIPYARDFMEIILLGNVFTHMYMSMNAVLRAASKPKQAMYATIFTVVLNVALDPFFIYDWGLGLGIRGAALATVLAQVLALIYQFHLLSDNKQLLHLKKGIYKLKTTLVKNIFAIGVSPFLMNVCACVVVIFINNQLVHYGGDLAVGAYGIANRIAFIFVMFVMGLNQGMQPIAGYNYGAQRLDRLMKVLNLSILVATGIMVTGWLIAMLLPYPCARLFTTDQTLINMAIHGIQVLMLMMPLVGFQMVTTNFSNASAK